MSIRNWALTGFALAAATASSGCLCPNDELHGVNISSRDSLTVAGDGASRKFANVLRATDPPTNTETLEFVWRTIEGSRSGDGISFTMNGPGATSAENIFITVAVPVALNQGDVYTVGSTFAIEPTVNGEDPRAFGPYDLKNSSQAEVSFVISDYVFPPGIFNATYRAVATTGTIRVAERTNGSVALDLNLTFTDATGKTKTVKGLINAFSETYHPPCD